MKRITTLILATLSFAYLANAQPRAYLHGKIASDTLCEKLQSLHAKADSSFLYGEYKESLKIFNEYLMYYDEKCTQNEFEIINVYLLKGVGLLFIQNFIEAEYNLNKAESLFDKLVIEKQESTEGTLISLRIATALGETNLFSIEYKPDAALENYTEGLDDCKAYKKSITDADNFKMITAKLLIANGETNVGHAKTFTKKVKYNDEQVLEHHEKANDILEDIKKDLDSLSDSLKREKRKEYELTLLRIDRVKAHMYFHYGRFYVKKIKYDKAVRYFEEMDSLAESRKFERERYLSLGELIKIHLKEGDLDKATEKFNVQQDNDFAKLIKANRSDSEDIPNLIYRDEYRERLLQGGRANSFMIIAILIFALSLFLLYRKMLKINRINKNLITANIASEKYKREMSHRIQNNLQAINSRIRIKLRKALKEPLINAQKIEAYRENASTIGVTLQIHSLLHDGNNIDTLDLKEYLNDLKECFSQVFPYGENYFFKELDYTLKIRADKTRDVGIVLNELITNAWKYSKAEPKYLSVSSEKVDDMVIFKVRDTKDICDKDMVLLHKFNPKGKRKTLIKAKGHDIIKSVVNLYGGRFGYSSNATNTGRNYFVYLNIEKLES